MTVDINEELESLTPEIIEQHTKLTDDELETASNRLIAARCRLLSTKPWYGTISMDFNWIRDTTIPTMGVSVHHTGVNCYWNPSFILTMTVEETYAVIQHEIEHIVRCHCTRKLPNKNIANIAMDMCINGRKDNPRIGYVKNGNKPIIPIPDKIVWIPPSWPADLTSEEYYAKLLKEPCPSCGNNKANGTGGKGNNGNGNGKGNCNCDHGITIDSHETWERTTVSPEEMVEIAKSIVNRGNAAGTAPGHLKTAIDQLNQSKLNWKHILRNYTGRHLGGKRTTYAKRSRRNDSFGTPGTSHRNTSKALVIIDTSGSIDNNIMAEFFTEIEAMLKHTQVSIIQWDTKLQHHTPKYKKNDWKNIKAHGRGGTSMNEATKWANNNYHGDLVIMLTDGYTAWHDQTKHPTITILTTDQPGPNYGINIKLEQTKP